MSQRPSRPYAGARVHVRILEHTDLDTTGVTAQYQRVTEATCREVKKLGHGRAYRANFDISDRLLFSLFKAGGAT